MAALFRTLALLAAILLAIPSALASEKVEGAETYVKLPTVILEMWDDHGVFHQVSIEMSAVFPAQTTINKSVGAQIKQALQAIPFEELEKGESTPAIKQIAIDLVRAQPGGAAVTAILITKMQFK